MFVDTHAHLNMPPLYASWQDKVIAARKAGVEVMIVPGVDEETNNKSLELARESDHIYAAIGIHPEKVSGDSEEIPYFQVYLESLSVKLTHEKVVAVGEIGLDYFRLNDNHQALDIIKNQRRLFKQQLSMAVESDLPVIIHTRTQQAMSDAVSDIKSVYGQKKFKGVFHCFTGSTGFYEELQDMGAMIGVGGLISRENQDSLRQVIAKMAMESILLETDSPYLTPQGAFEKVNQPAYVTITAQRLAEIFSVSLPIISEKTSRNAYRLFSRI